MKTKKTNLAIRIGFSIVGAIGLSSLCGGCTEEEARIGSFLGTVGVINPNSTPKEAALWGGVRQSSQDSLTSYNAEKSRSQVNVNVNNSREYYQGYPVYYWDEEKKTGSTYIINKSGEMVYVVLPKK